MKGLAERGRFRRVFVALLPFLAGGLALALLPRCGGQQALLLTVTADSLVDSLDITVKDLSHQEVVLSHPGEKVDPSNPNRDISKPGQGLKLALEFESSGHYLVYIQGQGPQGKQFFVRDFDVNGVRQDNAHLVALVSDNDNDGFPSCTATELCGVQLCAFFDCDDNDQNINPMATELCGNGKDDDCSAGCNQPAGTGDATCQDDDGDGESSDTDCDDHDPCRSHQIKEAASLCGHTLDEFKLPAACKKSLTAPFCGDGIDESCKGQDVACVVDKDCDGFSPPTDCNDEDSTIHPGATELCDGKDHDCDGTPDNGCMPCDVDGDGHAYWQNTSANCTLPRDDKDDFDAGIHLGSTDKSAGAEGGNVLGALRRWCSSDTSLEKDAKAPREVDHDGDGLAAKADGCPTTDCDKDGDGFKGSQCSPPASELDCNDNDYKIFPGAPDYCGDGIAQNCVADAACSCDKDGDKYCAPSDCDDTDPNVHPWATEICNGKDDDCDELIDEANVDVNGKPMTVSSRSCNDDNDGICGNCKLANTTLSPPEICGNGSHLLSGFCVCSPIDAKATKRDPGNNRVVCSGEDYNKRASPRCVGARQPEPKEHCAAGDFDCQNGDIKLGEDFTDKGRNCGGSTGECTMGVVTDCNLSNPYPYPDLATAVDSSFNKYWVCTGAVLPVPEKCNGKDDDCVGGPASTEVDRDGDGYLACNDCDDGDRFAYPGAPERCNDKDDNCNSQKDETPNECTTAGQTCCSSLKACKDLNNDFYNCRTCGQACPAGVSNRCSGGTCYCGSGSVCGSDQTCIGTPPAGTCTCDASICSNGCCSNGHCQTVITATVCGTGGDICKNCDDGKECTQDSCASGNCQNQNKVAGSSCGSGTGKCQGDVCCTGCWDGSSCQTGTTTSACGKTGNSCTSCSTANECQTVSCVSGSCAYANKTDGTSCTGGQCRSGSCCTGCWDGASCITSPTNAKCGTGGALCSSCQPGTCETASCATGTCVKTPASNISCTGGMCLNGTCCTGCITPGDQCADGTDNNECGTGGEPCSNCNTSGGSCTGGSCL